MSETDWQPIETAPKDGSFIMAAKESTLKWSVVPRFPYPLVQRWSADKGQWEADDGSVYEPQPTHWTPLLPSPPENTK